LIIVNRYKKSEKKDRALNALSALSLYPNTGTDIPDNGAFKYSKLKNCSLNYRYTDPLTRKRFRCSMRLFKLMVKPDSKKQKYN